MPDPISPVLLGEALKYTREVTVELLRELPSSLDTNAWVKMDYAGYQPSTGQLKLLSEDNQGTTCYEIRASFQLPYVIPAIPFFGVSLNGQGLFFGEPKDLNNENLTNAFGELNLIITVLFQSFQ